MIYIETIKSNIPTAAVQETDLHKTILGQCLAVSYIIMYYGGFQQQIGTFCQHGRDLSAGTWGERAKGLMLDKPHPSCHIHYCLHYTHLTDECEQAIPNPNPTKVYWRGYLQYNVQRKRILKKQSLRMSLSWRRHSKIFVCLFAYSNANLILLFILDRVTTRSMRTKTVKIEFINHWHALLQI